jgi:hypothetical protein
MIKRLKRIMVASALGLVILAAGLWVLVRVLDEDTPRYQGQTAYYWMQQANSRDTAASHQAEAVLNTIIFPRLTEMMFHDTNDSQLRLALIEQLNTLPGVDIYHTTADGRRAEAARQLGQAGPRAKAAIPRPYQSAWRQGPGSTRLCCLSLGPNPQ